MTSNNQDGITRISLAQQIIIAAIVLIVFGSMVFIIAGPFVNAGIVRPKEFVIKSAENNIQRSSLNGIKSDPIGLEQLNYYAPPCGSADKSQKNIVTTTGIIYKKTRLPILMYHYIDLPGTSTLPQLYLAPKLFEEQLKTLKNKCYQSVFISEAAAAILSDGALADKPIALTFDDGYEDMYTKAFPLLKKYNIKATMYVIVNALDKPGYLTKSQIKEMARSGFVEIASHTMNHANLRKSSPAAAAYEIINSKKELEKIIGQPVYDFAYPYGYFSSRDEQLCRQAGYLTCASTYPGDIQTLNKRYSLYRLRPGSRVGRQLYGWLELVGPKI